MLRYLVSTLLLIPVFSAVSQDMVLTSGQVTLSPGTRIALDGNITWTIGAQASVVNDGLIELGLAATLIETPGAPIVGSGTETAERLLNGAFTGVEPGGLGLTLGAPAAIGAITVTRGHSTVVLSNGAESVARWFHVDGDPPPSTAVDVTFRYDPVELNGLDAQDLVLQHSVVNDVWGGVDSELGPGPNMLSAQLPAPWGILTAFDADEITGVKEENATALFQLLGAPGDDVVHIRVLGHEPLRTWELFDAHGRLLASGRVPDVHTSLEIPMGPWAQGLVIFRLNGRSTHKWLR
jgi:hypothetical protein